MAGVEAGFDEQAFQRAEVVLKGAHGDAAGLGDVGVAGIVEPARHDHRDRRFEHLYSLVAADMGSRTRADDGLFQGIHGNPLSFVPSIPIY